VSNKVLYLLQFVFSTFGILSCVAQNTVTLPPSKIIYNHAVFWSKTEVNEIFRNGESPFGAGLDFVYRRKSGLNNNNMISERLRESIRPWVHYQFSPSARFSLSPLGYMFTNEYLGKESDLNRKPYHELRTTFQFFNHVYQFNKKIMHTFRYRYELRWQDNPATDQYRFFTRFRYRYRIRYVINKPNIYYNHALYAAVSNEIGLNLGKNVVMNTFNQNRLYIGMGYRMFNAMRVEFRYVDRFRTRGATGFEFDHGRGFMIGIYIDSIKQLRYLGDDMPTLKFID
jgi:hypothetical protein